MLMKLVIEAPGCCQMLLVLFANADDMAQGMP
jgi:hypothetical protein